MSDKEIEHAQAESWMKAPVDAQAFDKLYRFGRGLELEEDVGLGWTRLRYASWHAFGSCEELVEELIKEGESPDVRFQKSYPTLGFSAGDSILMTALWVLLFWDAVNLVTYSHTSTIPKGPSQAHP